MSHMGKMTNIFRTSFNKFFIIQHPQARFSLSFQKHYKSKANILKYAKYMDEMKVSEDLLQKVKKVFYVLGLIVFIQT